MATNRYTIYCTVITVFSGESHNDGPSLWNEGLFLLLIFKKMAIL